MTTTLTDPRVALWERRRTTAAKLAEMRTYSKTLCGCQTCDDSDLLEEQAALIQRATEAVDELGNQICEAGTWPTAQAGS